MGGVLVALSLLVTPAFAGITGTVMNADGVPIAGAQVAIHGYETFEARRGRLMSETPEAVPLAATRTNDKGAFTLESPKNAAVWLYVSASGYGPESRRVERDEDAGAIVMRKGAAGGGVITSGDGKPVANATVVLHYDNGRFEYVTKTNAAGRYEAPDPNRASAIAVLHPDYAIDEKTAANAPLTERDLTRTLAAGTKVTGRVVGADGRTPVANATLAIDSWPVGKSGEDGTFAIAHAPVRWSTLVARSAGLIGQAPFAKADAYTLRLAKAATVSGRVTDAKSKVPVAGAIVRAAVPRVSRGDALGAETDAKGGYSIVVPPGAYLVFTFRPGYDAANADVSVGPGQQVTRDFTVPQLARVSGTVLDEEKRPVAAAGIASINAGDPMREGAVRMMRSTEPVFSGPDGRFSTNVVPDQPLFLTAMKRGFPAARSEQLRAASGERKKGVLLTIPGGIAVTGRVTDGSGEPLSGVAVFPMAPDEDGNSMYRMMMPGVQQSGDDAVLTASDGTFTLRVAEGKYDFNFRREGYAPKRVLGQSITVSAAARVDAVMEPASEIAGRVVRGGNGVEGVSLTVFGVESRGGAVTGPDGSFTVSGLEAGSMRVMLRKESDFIQEMRNLTSPARDAVIELAAGGRVTGRVVGQSTGKPLTSFQAGISSPRNVGGRAMMAPPQMRDFSAEDGTFALDNVPPGAMFVVAGAPGYATSRLNVTIEEGKTLSDVELRLDAGVHLTGRVTGPNGTPLGDVTVRVETPGEFSSWGPETTAVTDANGEYSLETLPAGEGTVAFTHATYVDARRQVTLKGRETKLDGGRARERHRGDGSGCSGRRCARRGARLRGARRERGHELRGRVRDGGTPPGTLSLQRVQKRSRGGKRGGRRSLQPPAGTDHDARGGDDLRPHHRPSTGGVRAGEGRSFRRRGRRLRERRFIGKLPAAWSTERLGGGVCRGEVVRQQVGARVEDADRRGGAGRLGERRPDLPRRHHDSRPRGARREAAPGRAHHVRAAVRGDADVRDRFDRRDGGVFADRRRGGGVRRPGVRHAAPEPVFDHLHGARLRNVRHRVPHRDPPRNGGGRGDGRAARECDRAVPPLRGGCLVPDAA
ncbi:MAG TPA: carboxypeptidase regulatory-like domain-containing protein [Thermoanaerobaculia bacterium]|nr:carboxypeptidase regulatory-like domain-containing protein [Thermoanaerobaculia bacterium]